MTAATSANKRYPTSTWAETRQDFLLVSSFGLWASVLGLTPVLVLRFLVGG